MKKFLTLPNLYIALWGLYFTQGTLLPKGSILSRITLLLFVTISVVSVIYTYTQQKPNTYLNALGLLLAMFTVYGLFSPGDGFNYLKTIYLSLLPTFSFFVFFKQKKIDDRWTRIMFFFMAIVVVVQYTMEVNYNAETYLNSEEHVINLGYEFLALLPLIYFWKKKPIVQYVLLALIMVMVLSTVKRGAIIIGVLFIVYFLITSTRYSSKKIKWYIWLLGAVFVVLAVRYAIHFFENNQYAQMRVENTLSGDSSSRDYLYTLAWRIFKDSDPINMLFGHGASSTWRLMGNAAHNDWLEILVNQGIFGAVIYLYYWISFFKLYKKDKNIDSHLISGSLVIIYFMSTLFSMSYGAMTLPASVALGYCLANENKTILSNKQQNEYLDNIA